MHFLVLGDTKMGIFEEILRQKVLASTNFCQILVLGDTAILRDNGVAVSTFATRLLNALESREDYSAENALVCVKKMLEFVN